MTKPCGCKNRQKKNVPEVFDLDREEKTMDWDDFLDPDTKKTITCRFCKWKGKLSECKMREVNSPRSAWNALAGREGKEWFCPKCKMMVYNHYTRMS